ncbi:MAG TPA: thiamine-phosphate kinase [Gammaproteobacteria bacterium]|nr:thiamine-phosphate kinase [Gammaproteobacteria bacterium]
MEFDLIAFIKSKTKYDKSVILGINDDAAVLSLRPIKQLVVSTDTLVDGVHFDNKISPQQLGHKSLAVNLSDLAAMGATPKWFTLNLTLPKIEMSWIEGFINGLLRLAHNHKVNLVGGDTTQGPLSITITAFGEVETDQLLTRYSAQTKDLIAVTGQLGSAAFALDHTETELTKALFTPEPQLEISQQIREFATSCIDISDGLLADLGHICHQSQKGAKISLEQIPVNSLVKKSPQWSHYVLSGGDDYQLCFTFNPSDLTKLPDNCTIIGQICCSGGVRVYSGNKEIQISQKGYVHFSNNG